MGVHVCTHMLLLQNYLTRIYLYVRLAALYMRLPLIDPLHLFQGINITYSLVGPDVLYPREAKRKPAVMSIAFLYTIKRYLKYNFGPDD